MTIDFSSEVPIYLQVASEIEDAILSGAFPEEAQIPSTTEISAAYKINPATVLKGIAMLADGGILYKKRGVGMFVCAGAKARLMDKRRGEFYNRYVVRLLEEAERLHIRQEELIDMIQGGRYEQTH